MPSKSDSPFDQKVMLALEVLNPGADYTTKECKTECNAVMMKTVGSHHRLALCDLSLLCKVNYAHAVPVPMPETQTLRAHVLRP